jgi:hypothetical protein
MNADITFETWVSYPARAVNRPDGSLGLQFSVPVHVDLVPLLNDAQKTHISCEARVRAGLRWSQLGRDARVKLTGHVRTGPRGGQYFHCTEVEIIQPVPVRAAQPKPRKRAVKEVEF